MDLPRISLDPLAAPVAIINLQGVDYEVLPLTAAGYEQAKRLVEAKATPGAALSGAGALFDIVKLVLPTLPDEVRATLNADQATAILLTVTKQVEEVAKLFPSAVAETVTAAVVAAPPASSSDDSSSRPTSP